MRVVVTSQYIPQQFEWDSAKAESNLRKHGISFDTALLAFTDPFAQAIADRIVNYEQRWQTVGRVGGQLLLLVVHTVSEIDTDPAVEMIRIISARQANQKREGSMNEKMVRVTIDLANPPPLTDKQKAEIAALLARPESEIDYSDIPPLTEEFWKNAVRGRFYKPTKTSTTVRIDSDVLAWLRAQGKGYQSRINAILRREMLQSLKP